MPGALVPGRHTPASPVVSAMQLLLVPHAALGQVLQRLPAPLPAQQARQNAKGLESLSLVHTLHDLQMNETLQGSPVSPRGVQVPPLQVYPVAHCEAEVHWLVHTAVGTQKPSGCWQM